MGIYVLKKFTASSSNNNQNTADLLSKNSIIFISSIVFIILIGWVIIGFSKKNNVSEIDQPQNTTKRENNTEMNTKNTINQSI